jgi:hypothetical protein
MIMIDVVEITIDTILVIRSDLKKQFVLIVWVKCFKASVLKIVFETIIVFK